MFDRNAYMRKWKKTEKGKAATTKWNHSEKAKVVQTKHNKTEKRKLSKGKYAKSEKGRKKSIIDRAKYGKSEKGKMRDSKSYSKRRELGFHPISFPLNIPFDWHHVNKNDVVAIQRDIHRAVSHICGDGKLEGVVG